MDNKKADLQKLMDDINKEGVKTLKGENRKIVWGNEVAAVECLKTGFAPYDEVVGGEPRGRWTIDYGLQGSGKSTWNYAKIAALQKQGCQCVVVDAETGFDPEWCATQGVNMDDLLVIPAQETFERTLGDVKKMIASKLVDFLLIDSIHGVAMRAEVYSKGKGETAGKERSLDDDTQGKAAQKIGQFMRIVTPVLGKSKAMVTIIGQAREKIGQYVGGIHLSGGHALLHHAGCIRQWTRAKKDLWPKRTIDGKQVLVGFVARIKVEKTKVNASEGKEVYIPFVAGVGPSFLQANVDAAVIRDIITNPKTSWFHWGEEKINGRSNLYNFFEEKEEEYVKLMEALAGGFRDQEKEDGSEEE